MCIDMVCMTMKYCEVIIDLTTSERHDAFKEQFMNQTVLTTIVGKIAL